MDKTIKLGNFDLPLSLDPATVIHSNKYSTQHLLARPQGGRLRVCNDNPIEIEPPTIGYFSLIV